MSLNEAIELARGNRYQEAFPYFEKAYQGELDSFNEWSWYFYSKTLGKIGKLEAALKVNHFLLKKKPDFAPNLNLYGWHLHKSSIKNADNEEKLLSAANFIVKHTKQEQYSPYERTVIEVLKFMKDKPNTNYNQVLYWTEQLDPKLLNQEVFSFTTDEGKRMEIASPLEFWYQHRIRALFETKQYEGCSSLVDEAMSAIKSFHYSNDIWFRIRQAVSIGQLGDVEDAIVRLHAIGREKQYWTVYQELFHLYIQQEKFEKALEMGSFALLEKSGEFKHKIKLLVHMGFALEKIDKPKEALLHYCFVVKLRADNNWPIIPKIEDRIALLQQEESAPNNIKRELIEFWKEIKLQSLPKGTGKVKSLLPKGNAGFIESNTGEDLFFQVRNVRTRKIDVNSKVNFHIMNSFDQKKQRESKEAIEIVVI
ncbi:hypothetical protein GH741_03040 [Aquibacillus halophilus]|uniref:Tetratricopeptide repeat protein n=1 Tax=Aquibacillus halophilus TaxID=930132 RepID=A0A6A8DFL8_9BACI|nr:hypothetical protein [Aquibacillus halophilus]MRH41647.1 hypothetical protein [Aquibacillus halophilus]